MAASVEAFIAATRFGLGAAPGDLPRIAPDPRGWLERQIAAPPSPPPALREQEAGAARMAAFQRARQKGGDQAAIQLLRDGYRAAYIADAAARTRAQIESDTPFRERLVAFWSNHFTVSVQRPPVLGLAGPFEVEAIRPHVTGRFADLLLAATRHPAMLVYLDNAQSFGPNSRVGQRRSRGLNENHAREILELHTLGVNGGYTQADVVALAEILTGWSIGRVGDQGEGAFRFYPIVHEPGDKTLLGRRFAEDGEAEGKAALTAIARHPATARHVAAKLARHFIADRPPEAAVRRLERVFLDTDGDLLALTRAVVRAPEAWAEPLPKVKTPHEFVVSALRATAAPREPAVLVQAMRMLGQAPFAAPSPAGWPDEAEKWVAPEAVIRRAEWAMQLAMRVEPKFAPQSLHDATIGPVASEETRAAVARAPSAADAIAMLFASPEFQRR